MTNNVVTLANTDAPKPARKARAPKINLDGASRAIIKAVTKSHDGYLAEIAALQACAVDGVASETYCDIYKAACFALELSLGKGDAGLIAAQRLMATPQKTWTKEQIAARDRIAARLSRRLASAGLESAKANGRKRGTKVAPKATKVTTSKTVTTIPAPKVDARNTQEPDNAPVNPIVEPKTMRAPILVNEAEFIDHINALVSYVQMVQRKNSKAATHRVRNVIKPFVAANAILQKALADEKAKSETK